MNRTMILCRFMKPRENIAAFTCEIDWNDRKAVRDFAEESDTWLRLLGPGCRVEMEAV